MRFVRYIMERHSPQYGWVMNDKVGPIEGDIFGEYRRMEAEFSLSSVRLISPVAPSKIICVGRNYAEHAREQNAEMPEMPLLFLKPPSAVIGPEDAIQLPPQSNQVEHEAELAVVIGKRGHWLTPLEVEKYILGYTIANDVTARDLQRKDGQWTRAKGFDTFCPIGPWIDTEFDPSDSLITCRVNQEIRQMASTREMAFSVAQIVSYASSVMTLEPGDIILTGTPAGIGPLRDGDRVDVEIDGIGTLSNPVISRAG